MPIYVLTQGHTSLGQQLHTPKKQNFHKTKSNLTHTFKDATKIPIVEIDSNTSVESSLAQG